MYKRLVEDDIITKLEPYLPAWHVNAKTHKLQPLGNAARIVSSKVHWIFVSRDPYKRCMFDTAVFKAFGFIPSRCLNCWKVVVKPKTLKQLWDVYQFQIKFTKGCVHEKRFCKCGPEERPWVPQNYGAYFYASGKTQGLKRWEQIREAVDQIDPSIDVVLKRFCTEFEIATGPSDKYESPAWAKERELRIYGNANLEEAEPLQPDLIKERNIRFWIEHAWSVGDMTCLGFNGGKPLYNPSVTYHPKERRN